MKLSHVLKVLPACLVAISAWHANGQEGLGDEWGTAEREAEYYRITEIEIPDPLFVEAGSFETMPDGRVAVGTRRGDIFLLDGISEANPRPKFHRYASGFDELLGLSYNAKDGALYAIHATEVTRILDTDKDGRADRYETHNDAWGFDSLGGV